MRLLENIIMPLRVSIVVLWTLLCGIFGMILALLIRNPKWVQMFVTRWVWTPVLCAVSGVVVRLHGKENILMNETRVYAANHASQFDIVAMCRVMPLTLFYIVKMELKKIPIVGWYIYLLGHIFVDRKNHESAQQSMRAAAKKIKEGKNIISFAEGTRSKTGELLMFRRGPFIIAKEGSIDVVPVAIQGSHHVLPSGSFVIRSGVINIYIGSAIKFSEYQNMSVEELAAYTRERVKQMLDTSSVI